MFNKHDNGNLSPYGRAERERIERLRPLSERWLKWSEVKRVLGARRHVIIRSNNNIYNFNVGPVIQFCLAFFPTLTLLGSIIYGVQSGLAFQKTRESALQQAQVHAANYQDLHNRYQALSAEKTQIAASYEQSSGAWQQQQASYEARLAQLAKSYVGTVTVLDSQQRILNDHLLSILEIAEDNSALAAAPRRYRTSKGHIGLELAFVNFDDAELTSRNDVGPFANLMAQGAEQYPVSLELFGQVGVAEGEDDSRAIMPLMIAQSHQDLLNRIEVDLTSRIARIKKTLNDTGLSNRTANISARTSGVGGPFVASDDRLRGEVSVDGASGIIAGNESIAHVPQLSRIGELVQQFAELRRVVGELPIGSPLGDDYIVTSHYGIRIDPFNGKEAFHAGIDLVGNLGDPIHVVLDGRVTSVGDSPTLGLYVAVDHGEDVRTYYAHLDKIAVRSGDNIARGDIIGYVGNTGRSTGPHLHYEIVVGGERVNPAPLIMVHADVLKKAY